MALLESELYYYNAEKIEISTSREYVILSY